MLEKIVTMEKNVEKEMTLFVTGVADKGVSKSGDPFVGAELFDGEKKIRVHFFKETVDSLALKGLLAGSIIVIKLVYDGRYYNEKGWNLCDDPTVSKNDFVHMAPIDPEECFEELLGLIRDVNSNPDGVGPYKSLAHLTEKILMNTAHEFKRSSAAVSMHHNFLSGLLYHTIRMVRMAKKACEVYTDLDEELLICGTALHDIGKISCYDTDSLGEAGVTVEGRLLDHALTGILMLHDMAKEDLYNQEKLMMLEHMLASHHGKKEYDAISIPAFPEAMMLHLIDMMDSKMNMFEEAYRGQEEGKLSDFKVWGLENSTIYKSMRGKMCL